MADETINTGEVAPAAQEQITKTPEQLEKEISDRIEAKYKAELAGMNQAVARAKKENETLLQKTLTAEELAQRKIEEAKQAETAALQNAEKYRKSLAVDKALTGAGLPLDFSDRVLGTTDEEIAEDVKRIKTLIDAEVSKRVSDEIKKTASGAAPTGGQPGEPKMATYAEFTAMRPKEQSAFITSGGKIKD